MSLGIFPKSFSIEQCLQYKLKAFVIANTSKPVIVQTKSITYIPLQPVRVGRYNQKKSITHDIDTATNFYLGNEFPYRSGIKIKLPVTLFENGMDYTIMVDNNFYTSGCIACSLSTMSINSKIKGYSVASTTKVLKRTGNVIHELDQKISMSMDITNTPVLLHATSNPTMSIHNQIVTSIISRHPTKGFLLNPGTQPWQFEYLSYLKPIKSNVEPPLSKYILNGTEIESTLVSTSTGESTEPGSTIDIQIK